MTRATAFLLRRRGGPGSFGGWHWTDIVTFGWLFKSPAQLSEFPPSLLPYESRMAVVEGYDKPLPLFIVTDAAGTRTLAEVRRVGTVAQMVDPLNPGEIQKVNIKDRVPDREIGFAWASYTEPFLHFDFLL